MDNNCNCRETIIEHSTCNQCAPTPCDGCQVKDLSTDCVLYDGDRLECSDIETNQPLTEVIIALDQYICTAIAQLGDSINLVSVGAGAQIYAGIDNLGKRKIKTLTSTNSSVNITSGADTINLSAPIPDGTETKINAGSNITITGVGTIASPYVVNTPNQSVPDGTETKIIAGTNVSITGNGTIALPYVVNTPIPNGAETRINPGNNITISGVGTILSPYVINSLNPDGSETKINVGSGLTVSGLGTIDSPYIINKVNLQKTVITSTNYLLLNADLDHLIFIDNGASNITINVPNTLPDNFEAGFLRLGTGEVSFTPIGGSILRSPGGKFRIAEQNGNAFIVKQSNTLNISVNGSLKV